MEEKKYMSLRDKINYGMGNFGSQFVMTFIGSFILIFLTDTVGLQSGVVGTLMAVSMVLDGLTDVFFGAILDRTHSKWGKARPWMLIGIIPLVVCEVLLFMVPQAASENMKYVYFFVFYTMLNAIFYTIVAVSYNTLTALVTKNESERVQIGVIGFMLNFIAALLIPSLTPTLVGAFGGGVAGWRIVAIIFAVIAAVGLGITAITAKELPEEVLNEGKPVDTAEKMRFRDSFRYLFRNKYFFLMLISMMVFTMNSICFTSSGTYFAKYIMENENMLGILTMTTMAPMIVALLLTPTLVKKFGLFKVISVGQAISFGFSLLAMLCAFTKLYIPMLVCFVFRSLFMGPFAGTGNALTAEICEYSYLKDGVRIDGTMFSCISVGSKVGNGLSTAVIGWILQIGGYVGTAAVQTSGALTAIILVYVGLPVVYAGLNALFISRMNVMKANNQLREAAKDAA